MLKRGRGFRATPISCGPHRVPNPVLSSSLGSESKRPGREGGHSVRHTWEQPADLAEAHRLPQTDSPATWQVKGGVQQLSLQDGFLLWSETQQREWNDLFLMNIFKSLYNSPRQLGTPS